MCGDAPLRGRFVSFVYGYWVNPAEAAESGADGSP